MSGGEDIMEAIVERNAQNPFEADDIRQKAHTILEEYAEAARDGLLDSKAKEMDQFLRMIELQKNRLHVSEDDNVSRVFYSGQIAGIMLLCKFLNDYKKNESEYVRISQNNKLLTKCIMYIGEKSTASSQQIIKDLALKHRSSLTNMIERQKSLSLISTYKIHNRNVYMLTEKGRQIYYQHILIKSGYGTKEKAISNLFDVLIHAIDEEKINQFDLVADLCEIDNSMERYLTSLSFINKITNYCEAFSSLVQKEARKTFIEKARTLKLNPLRKNRTYEQENDYAISMDDYSAYLVYENKSDNGESLK